MTGAYGFWRTHVRTLLTDAPDPDALLETLLAPLAPEVYQEQRRRGLTQQQITASLTWLSERLLRP
ncbi:hypothetical protein [Lentzea jiangxiensis]|uniref:Uncharacterized protein n=1 Tax=Lentzea jiangxiensis TaxID=641025 RepID=A0A1H0J2N7_9PSEU|nr:hypothetical protein [Lentzea jiangxiensis]SDO37783.1 hypothetical protein SAMN05421507_102337 [Lentzea jiangxiensis]